MTGAAFLIADDHQRGKAEAFTALHNLSDAVDVDEFVDELTRLALIAPAAAFTISFWFTCHVF